jgi:hypothetical protein
VDPVPNTAEFAPRRCPLGTRIGTVLDPHPIPLTPSAHASAPGTDAEAEARGGLDTVASRSVHVHGAHPDPLLHFTLTSNCTLTTYLLCNEHCSLPYYLPRCHGFASCISDQLRPPLEVAYPAVENQSKQESVKPASQLSAEGKLIPSCGTQWMCTSLIPFSFYLFALVYFIGALGSMANSGLTAKLGFDQT